MIEPCPVCGSADADYIGPYRGTHAVFTGLIRARCRSCEMVYASPMPGVPDLEAYNSNFFANAYESEIKDSAGTPFFSGIARLRMAHVERYLDSRSIAVSSVMEFGPGYGYFARNWLGRHPETVYLAFETDASCHASLKEMNVRLVDVSARAKGIAAADLVVMSHVLEHISKPVEFIRNTTRYLRKGGVLFVEVPCRDWEYKSIDESHLLFFDKGPMNIFLSRLGFKDIQLSYHGLEIEQLRGKSPLGDFYLRLRSRMITLGIVAPFAGKRKGLEAIEDPLERALLKPYKGYVETQNPAWWLRAVACKG